jgi:hypothetical protein
MDTYQHGYAVQVVSRQDSQVEEITGKQEASAMSKSLDDAPIGDFYV